MVVFLEKDLSNDEKYETSFKNDDFEFASSNHLTFFVYVYNVKGHCKIEVSISHPCTL